MEKALSRPAGTEAARASQRQRGGGFLVRLIEEPLGAGPLVNAAKRVHPASLQERACFALDARERACEAADDVLAAFWHEMSDLFSPQYR